VRIKNGRQESQGRNRKKTRRRSGKSIVAVLIQTQFCNNYFKFALYSSAMLRGAVCSWLADVSRHHVGSIFKGRAVQGKCRP
jgi:hypothetical protein